MAPSKRIHTGADLAAFQRSQALARLQRTLLRTIEKIKGRSVPHDVLNPNIVTRDHRTSAKLAFAPQWPGTTEANPLHGVWQVLNELDALVDATPPQPGPRRFGNLSCRVWHDRMAEAAPASVRTQLPGFGAWEEASYYLVNAFGSKMRLDYGTGHELSFMAFVGSLVDTGYLDWDAVSPEDVLAVYSRYFDVARKLILVYNLEPAGSHGVWGLDDHFHLIYILGAAQFVESAHAPAVSSVLSSATIARFRTTSLYVNAVAFIFTIKTGPFHEHSPIINDIHTSVTLWSKVLKGLLKMYEVEVLGKFPVVQHFWMGELYPWRDSHGRPLPESEPPADASATMAPTHTTRSNISMTAAPWARR
ncbi:serine/threonine-protein phosphatase 2A activator 1 [Diutina catenulata]